MAEEKPQSDPQQPLLEDPPDIDKDAVVEQAVQAIATTKQPKTVRDLLQGKEFKDALRAVLPRAMRPDRFVRVALTAMMRTPDLAECSRESLFKALLDLSSYGLEPDGRRAHLIPFRNKKMCSCGHEMDTHRGQDCSRCECRHRRTLVECQLIIDYKGLAELVRRSGDVSYIHADVVYGADEWSYGYGTEAHLRHKPSMKDRGERVAFYSYVRLKDGSEDFIVMSPVEVDKIRERSKASESGPWVTDYDEMGKKTVFRRHSKWLPLSVEVRKAVESEDDVEPVDISGWAEVLEEPKAQEGLPSPATKLRDRLMPGKGEPAEAGK